MDELVGAVHALYGATDPAQQARANQWLTAFQRRDEAWQAPFALLDPGQPEEVQFFAATVLVRKVRTDWSRLDAGRRQALNQAIRAKFQEALAWQRLGELVLRQLCAALAAVAGASGGEGANELTTQALGLLLGSPPLALRLLTALAEEADGLDRVRRLALVGVLAPRGHEVLAALGALLAAAAPRLQQGDRGPEVVAAAALRCAEAWLQLTPVAGSGCCASPGALHRQQPALLGAALALLGCGGEAGEAAVQLLLLLFGPDSFGSDEAADQAATSELARALLSCGPRLGGAGGDGALAAGVAKLASAAADREPDYVCGQMAEAAALSALVLQVLALPGPELAAHTVDYFLMANTVPLAERPPELRAPLFEAVAERVVPHASYPPAFASWEEEAEVDEEAFGRLREQYLPELLEACYGQLRARYLAAAWQLLQGAPSWQAAEAALFLVSAVGLSVRTRLMGGGGGGGGDENSGGGGAPPPHVAADREQSSALLAALLGSLCSPEGAARVLGAHPALAAAACRAVEQYAAWLGRAGGAAPLQGAFSLLLGALPVPQASRAAAAAFQQLCLRCAWRLREPAAFGWLLEAALGALRQAGDALPIAQRQLVVEGLARVAAGLRGQALLDAAAALAAPFLQQAAAAAAAGGAAAAPDARARRALPDALLLLAAALRHLAPVGDERGELGAPPAARLLAEAAPTLALVAESPAWQADADAAAAVAEVHRRAVGTAKQHGLQLALGAMRSMAALFAATALPACLDVVGEALEQQHEQPGVGAAAVAALGAACDAALPALAGGGLRERPALAAALLGLAHQCALYAPTDAWASGALPALTQLAAAALALREADPVARALELAARLAGGGEAGELEGASGTAAQGVLAAQGEALTAALLAAVCDTCPRHLMRAAADCLRRLLAHPALGGAAAGWLASAAASPRLPGVPGGYLTADDCAAFASLARRVRGPRFLALVVDFGLLARGCNTSDVLLAYEM